MFCDDHLPIALGSEDGLDLDPHLSIVIVVVPPGWDAESSWWADEENAKEVR